VDLSSPELSNYLFLCFLSIPLKYFARIPYKPLFNRPHAIPRRLEPIIPTSQDLCNAQERGQTIFDYKHNSPVAQVYLELSKNMEKNLRRIEKENTQDVKELSDKEVRQISDEIRADLN
jgi:nitrogenase subunit NifH